MSVKVHIIDNIDDYKFDVECKVNEFCRDKDKLIHDIKYQAMYLPLGTKERGRIKEFKIHYSVMIVYEENKKTDEKGLQYL